MEEKKKQADADADLRRRVRRFYEVYNPVHVGDVDMILKVNAGRKDEIVQQLTVKYGPEPDPLPLSPPHSPCRRGGAPDANSSSFPDDADDGGADAGADAGADDGDFPDVWEERSSSTDNPLEESS